MTSERTNFDAEPTRPRRGDITASGAGWGLQILQLGLAFLLVLLVTRLVGFAARSGLQSGISELFLLAVRLSAVLLLGISKLLGFGARLLRLPAGAQIQLSNQKFRSWVWDEVKGFLVGLVFWRPSLLNSFYFTIRQWPQHWWLVAWALFMGLFVLLAQLAPVVLFPSSTNSSRWTMRS